MEISIALILFVLLLLSYFVVLPPLFAKAGIASWKGYVPILQWVEWCKMLKRPWYWVFLMLIPGVNFLVFVILNVETAIAFDKRSTQEQWMFGALPWYSMPKLAFDKDATYVGPRDHKRKKSQAREWSEAILFAVIAATVIRSFFFEAFTIPTPSMEASLSVGDYLFVSKTAYGAKVPEIPLSLPFLHHSMPGSTTRSYVEWIKLPYWRMPGLGKPERFDPVVFNFPTGDTVINTPKLASHGFYQTRLSWAYQSFESAARGQGKKYTEEQKVNNFFKNKGYYYDKFEKGYEDVIITRPRDKKEHYIKSCVALPGETIEIKHMEVFIDGTKVEDPENSLTMYGVFTKDVTKVQTAVQKQFDIRFRDHNTPTNPNRPPYFGQNLSVTIPPQDLEQLMQIPGVDSVRACEIEAGLPKNSIDYFPHDAKYRWSRDNFGPLKIPAEGQAFPLNEETLPLYIHAIVHYEHKSVEVREGKIFVDGEETTSYTWEQDYYWMMGDNRHHSADSRVWGFVPFDHVVGKASFCWFSKENEGDHIGSDIRWERMFKLVD